MNFYLQIILIIISTAFVLVIGRSGADLKCPNNVGKEDYDWEYYDNVTNTCYPAFKRGPCGTYMLFYRESDNSQYGVCNCIYGDSCFRKLPRPIAKWPKDNQCYLLYEQGPCKPGEWLVFDKNWKGVCEANKCIDFHQDVNITVVRVATQQDLYEKYEDFPPAEIQSPPEGLHPWDTTRPFNFFYNGKCYKTFTQGPCKTDEVFQFGGTYPVPYCHKLSARFGCGSATGSGVLKCPSRFMKNGDDCIPIVNSQWSE